MDELSSNPMYAMLELLDAFEPLVEAANGLRAKLENEGFSPAAAEAVATEFLMGVMRKGLA